MSIRNGCVASGQVSQQHTKKRAVAAHVIVRDYQMTMPALIHTLEKPAYNLAVTGFCLRKFEELFSMLLKRL